MDGSYITDYRTGAATGVVIKYLTKKGAKVVGIIGTGIQLGRTLLPLRRLFLLKKSKVQILEPKSPIETIKESVVSIQEHFHSIHGVLAIN